jgi:spore coat polysaccharide biosynthesis protein SpsF
MISRNETARPYPQFGVFLHARIGSTRLKGKVLLPLGDRSVIEHAMRSLRRCDAEVNLLLTDYESEERLAPIARSCGFELFAGSSEDVLARYASALRSHPVEYIVRATGDNPLVSSELVLSLLDLHIRRGADFSGYLGMPLGLGVEIVNSRVLLIEDAEARDPYEREHVNPFLYRRPERFSILHPEVHERYQLPDSSITLDTEEDYRYLTALYADLYTGEPLPVGPVLSWLKTHPRDIVKEGYRPGREGALRSVG